MYQTALTTIAAIALKREEGNDHFLRSLRNHDSNTLDEQVHDVYETIAAAIDCTACGNCCKTLVINVTQDEIGSLAEHLHISREAAKEQYIEEILAGNCFINTMPCHFLADNKCTIYTARFSECRDFPHLHKPRFKARLAGTLGHYGRCPIIYNVEMKVKTGFMNIGNKE